MSIDQRLRDLKIELPRAPSTKIARIAPYSFSGDLLFVSGQLPQWEGEIRFKGKAGREYSTDQAAEAARLSALNVIAQAKHALDGDLERIRKFQKLTGYVNCTPDFEEIAHVVNGASDLVVGIFGDKGVHSRTAVGAGSMPLGVTVEIEAIIEVTR
jgi:enamine deaminase RidA (YjgF/YER057c/UK114 family)